MNLHLALSLFGVIMSVVCGNSTENLSAAAPQALRKKTPVGGQTSKNSNSDTDMEFRKCIQCSSCSDSSNLPSMSDCSSYLQRFCVKKEEEERDGTVTVSRRCSENTNKEGEGPHCVMSGTTEECEYYCKTDGCNGSPTVFNLPPRQWTVLIILISILF